MTILQTIDKMNKINANFNPQLVPASADLMNSINQKAISDSKDASDGGAYLTSAPNKQLYFVNLDSYLQQQYRLNNSKLHLSAFYSQPQGGKLLSQPILDQQADSDDNDRKDRQSRPSWTDEELLREETAEAAASNEPSTASNCFSCFDRITEFIERRLVNRQPVFNLIKCFIVLLTIIQFCLFLLSMITYKNNEQKHFYPKHGDYFILGTNLANLNALLSTIFYLYSIIGEVFPLLTLMTSLQAFYSILELLALLTEPIKVQYIYVAFIMLASLQTFSMLLFVVMLRIKKIQESKVASLNLNAASYV